MQMIRPLRHGLVALLLLLIPFGAARGQQSADDAAVADALRDILATGAPPVTDIDAAAGPEPLAAMRGFYAARQDRPLWTPAAAQAAQQRLSALGDILPPTAVPLAAAAGQRAQATDPRVRAERELLLSAAYGIAAIDARSPAKSPGPGQAVVAALQAIAAAGDPLALLADTLPMDPGFWRLRAAIVAYRMLAASGGWGSVPDGPKLQLGDDGVRVEALRHRLIATGDLANAASSGAYDQTVFAAVQHFQIRHGLEPDGVVGARTLMALNLPVERRLGTMEANLLRQQRQHRSWGSRYVAVNIAAASYRLVIGGAVVFERPAVVGRPSWPTPLLDSVIDSVEFHPYWRVPMRIADEELWPKQDADANYFTAQGIHVVDDQLVQDPGPLNPLGAVKFVFDNPFSVYLHDTTAPGLFAQAFRFASHGCVRIADADDFARQLLAPDPQWPADKVAAALRQGGHQTVPLTAPIPIHIVYDTAWVDADGTIQFRDDIYRRDQIPPRNGAPAETPESNGVPIAAAEGTAAGTCDG